MRRNITVAVYSAFLAFNMPAQAHHSGVMYDTRQQLTLQGTVSEFQWSNPHCWIQLRVTGGVHEGEWSIELGSPTQLFRSGWRPGTLQAGQPITLQVHPMRDGTLAAQFVSRMGADAGSAGAAPESR